jgi:superfamily II DNA or RNA helicase
VITLRPYQNAAISAVLDAYEGGINRQAIQLPTGAGKTVVFCSLCQQRGGRSLILAHRDELIIQAQQKMHMVAPELSSGIVKAERNETAQQITIASVQSLARPARLERFPRAYDTVIVDEAHHTAAESYHRILEHVVGPNTLLLGVSATLERTDRKGLDDMYDSITYETSMLDLMRQGYLCDIKALEIGVKLNMRGLHKQHGDYIGTELADRLDNADAPRLAVEAWEKHALGRRTLLFAPTIASARSFMQAFADAGYSTSMVEAGTPEAERHEILRRFGSGDITVLCNCMVLTEGYDEPAVDCIIMARPTCSRPLYTQMLGRGTRTHIGKTHLLVLDLVAVSSRVGDLLTAATLFGVEPQPADEDELDNMRGNIEDVLGILDGLDVLRDRQEAMELEGELVAREVDLFRRRNLHWGISEGGIYTLSAGADGVLLVQPTGNGLYDVIRSYRSQDPFERYPSDKSELLRTGLDIGYAQGHCEDYVHMAGAMPLVRRDAPWRRKPPSERSLAFAKVLGVKVPEGAKQGDVSDLIDAAKAQKAARALKR